MPSYMANGCLCHMSGHASICVTTRQVEHFSIYALVEICKQQTSSGDSDDDGGGTMVIGLIALGVLILLVLLCLIVGYIITTQSRQQREATHPPCNPRPPAPAHPRASARPPACVQACTHACTHARQALKSQAGYDALKNYALRHKDEPKHPSLHIADVQLPEETLKRMIQKDVTETRDVQLPDTAVCRPIRIGDKVVVGERVGGFAGRAMVGS